MKNLLYLLLVFLSCMSCQNKQGQKVEDEDNLLKLTSLNSIDYAIIYELNELKKMNEGIYLAVIKPSEQDFKAILANVEENKIKGAIDSKYTVPSWSKTPSVNVDMDIFNYSPAVTETEKELQGIKEDLTEGGNFYCYYQEQDYPMNIGLYVVDVSKQQIKIYQTYF